MIKISSVIVSDIESGQMAIVVDRNVFKPVNDAKKNHLANQTDQCTWKLKYEYNFKKYVV